MKNLIRLIPVFNNMIINAWVTDTGKIIDVGNKGDHYLEVSLLFPNISNPEKYVEDIGWIKISGGKVIFNKVNQSQINALFERLDPDEYKKLLDNLD